MWPVGCDGFDWTINSYRGWSHACGLLPQAGDTPILMADGTSFRELKMSAAAMRSTEPFAAVAVLALGRENRGPRRLGDRKPAFRAMLEDGTELVASGYHRS